MPTIHPALTQTLALPGYCNHAHELHDGQTRYILTDIEEYGTGRSTVQLYRLNYYKEPDQWELLWDLTRDEPWDSARRKPGAGHSIALNPMSRNLIISVPWKGLGEENGTSGVTMFSFARADIPALEV